MSSVDSYVSGFKKVVGHRVYEGEVSFIPSSDKDSHPRDRTICKAGWVTLIMWNLPNTTHHGTVINWS